MPIQYLHHISLGVKDLDASVEFYTTFMGFRKIKRPDLGFDGAWLKLAMTQLHLIDREGGVPEKVLPSTCHYAFQVHSFEELDEREEMLKTKNVPYKRTIQRDSGIHQIFFQDPTGHHIELGFYPD